LRQIARARRFAPKEGAWADEDAPVQVMDLPEAAGSRFDALWIAGLDANAWPEAPRPNPFLPGPVQRAAELPPSSPERELAYARRVTARLLAAAPEVVCSFARYSGDEELRVSPLIEMLPEVPDTARPWESIALRIFNAAVSMGGAALEEQPYHPAPPVVPGSVQHGGMSVLKDQAACPFRAFAIHRLGAREPDTAELGISAAERGTVAHKALELFWSDVQSQGKLLAMTPTETSVAIERCVSAALDSRLSRRQRSKALDRARALELERWKNLLLEWLSLEKSRPSFAVVEREILRPVEAGGLTIGIKADRLDRFEDGTYAILDYKTSDKLSVKDWDGERPDAPQLPLYATKSEHDISAVHFAQLVPGDVKFPGHDGEELKARLPEWKRVVAQLGASFMRGDAAVDPKHPHRSCEFCKLHSLCRVGELREGDGTGE
jgi:ATP-dependent helicase/nuclease subunit B